MPRGGVRAGAGRPKGSGVKSAARTAYKKHPGEVLTATEYLVRVVNDESADPSRRDKCAAVLSSIEFRSGKIPLGKKARLEAEARLAGWGSRWYALLNDTDAEGFDPNGLTPQDRAEWDAKQRAKQAGPGPKADAENDRWNRYLNDDPPDEPETPPRRRTMDEALRARHDNWTGPDGRSDLEYNPRGYPYPPNDE